MSFGLKNPCFVSATANYINEKKPVTKQHIEDDPNINYANNPRERKMMEDGEYLKKNYLC